MPLKQRRHSTSSLSARISGYRLRSIEPRFLYCQVRLDRNADLDATVRRLVQQSAAEQPPAAVSEQVAVLFARPAAAAEAYQFRSILVGSPNNALSAAEPTIPTRAQTKRVSFSAIDKVIQIPNTPSEGCTVVNGHTGNGDRHDYNDASVSEEGPEPATTTTTTTTTTGLQLHHKLEHQRQEEHQRLLGKKSNANKLKLQLDHLNQEMKLQLQQQQQQQQQQEQQQQRRSLKNTRQTTAARGKRKQLLRIDVRGLLYGRGNHNGHHKTKNNSNNNISNNKRPKQTTKKEQKSDLEGAVVEGYGKQFFRSYVRLSKIGVDALKNVPVQMAEQMLVREMRVEIKRHVL